MTQTQPSLRRAAVSSSASTAPRGDHLDAIPATPRATPQRLYVSLLLHALAYGLTVPALPALVAEVVDGAAAQGAHMYGWLLSAGAFVELLTGPGFGTVSDHVGRRGVMLVALAGALGDFALLAWGHSVAWLFAARLCGGLSPHIVTMAYSYVADCCSPRERLRHFGMIGAMFGVGFSVGPAIGGVLAGTSARLPFVVAACCTLANVAYVLAFIPESLATRSRAPLSVAKINPVGSLAIFGHGKGRGLLLVGALFFFMRLSTQLMNSTWVLYAQERFAWASRDVGVFLTCTGLVSAAMQGGVMRLLVARVGSEKTLLLLSMGVHTLSLALYAHAASGAAAYTVLLLTGLGTVANPLVTKKASVYAPPERQGQLQGAMGCIKTLCRIIGPIAGTWALGENMPFGTATPLMLGALLGVVSLALASLLPTPTPTSTTTVTRAKSE